MHEFIPWRYRSLALQLARREVLSRYRGTYLGVFWSLLQPFLMLVVYTFVFQEVFKARWPGAGGGQADFALRLFAGLLTYQVFSDVVARAPNLVRSQPNMVKKVIFPLAILPWVACAVAYFDFLLNLAVLMLAALAIGIAPSVSWLFLPLLGLVMLPLLLGLGWLLSSLGVFISDIGQAVAMLVTLLMFLSPVFYPASALPDRLQGWLLLNPVAPVIEGVRALAFGVGSVDYAALAVVFAVGSVVALAGGVWFARTRKGFADVL
ncbi:MAG: ABC transporter permease [Burkholderiales bacterium]|jgi:lipopolysaccharide transport system permease protein|nr:ABC transporter permease [Burkholderiales bacterium]MBK9346506.1 ABC transporter permease [Burkholderiales bacterium]